MKPVDKGDYIPDFNQHGDAKPELEARLGLFCSYCEAPACAQQLDVEHIYPQAKTAHPNRSKKWRNFLLSCKTCNTYKSQHLGNGKQLKMLKQYLWPHIDNTFRAFEYSSNGSVNVNPNLSIVSALVIPLAQATIDMAGLMLTQNIADNYERLGIAYSHIKKREEAWGVARRALIAYEENPSPNMTETVLDNCMNTGYFSIWMKVFSAHPNMCARFVDACNASPDCFNAGVAIARGRT
jgi:uncharacterized protein (TIGR02646 family)